MTLANETPRYEAWTAAAIALIATCASAYIVSLFLRSSIGVIAPNLVAEVSVTAGELGILSSAFFFSFAAVQIPLGVAIDRFGPKRCMLACAVIMIAGTLTFANAQSPLGLITARVLMGVGTSCFLVAPLTLYARKFAPERFAMLAGLQLSLGSIGALIATAPLAYATAAIGWRTAFVLVAALMGVVTLIIALIVTDGRSPTSHRETVSESLAGVREASRQLSVAPLFIMHMVMYSSFALIIGLWGGPYLTHVYGYTLIERGDLLLIAAGAQIVGMFLWGQSDRLTGSYKLPIFVGAGATAALLITLGIVGALPPALLIAWFAVFGFCTAYTPVVIAHGKALFPARLVGRGITLLNMGSMAGSFLSQILSGAVVSFFAGEATTYPIDAYRAVFFMQAGLTLAALAAYAVAHDPLKKRMNYDVAT